MNDYMYLVLMDVYKPKIADTVSYTSIMGVYDSLEMAEKAVDSIVNKTISAHPGLKAIRNESADYYEFDDYYEFGSVDLDLTAVGCENLNCVYIQKVELNKMYDD